jgi:pimeloyl-ACP methyl ester carboxylesterase
VPLINVRGVTLEYFHKGPESSTPFILVHGAGSSARIWDSVQTDLSSSGHESYAISLRGAGGSDHTSDSSDYHPSNYALDVLAVLADLDINRCVLVGHSLGTIVASYILREAPEVVDKLIQIAGPVVEKSATQSSMNKRTHAGYGEALSPEAFAHWESQHLGLSSEVRQQLRSDIDNNPSERILGQARPWSDITGVPMGLRVSALVVLGDADDVVPPEEPLSYFLQLPAALRHLHVFSGVGHYPNAQVPDRLASVMRRFVSNN